MTEEQQYLERAIARYPASVAATARASLQKLRAIYPGANLLVYDRRQSLPIGIASAAGGGAVFSVVLYLRWVRFFLLEGADLEDPDGRLEGTGTQVRSILVDAEAEILSDPAIKKLIKQAETMSGRDLRTGPGHILIKSRLSGNQTALATARKTTKARRSLD